MRKMLSRNQTIELVNEAIESGEIHCDPSTEVKVGDINSESATAGKVIVADGDGGAEWGSIQAGMDVVELSSSSGTLSDSDYAKVSGNNCLIFYDNNIYYKEYLDTELNVIGYFSRSYYTNTDIKTHMIEINTTTKGYSYHLTTYPKQNITANPTLAGTESSLEGIQIGSTKYKVGSSVVAYEGTSSLPTGVVFENWTLHRAIKDGNILWIVCAGNINNTTAEAVSITNIFEISIPSEISSKIYRADGSTCNNSFTTNGAITSFVGARDNAQQVFRLNSNEANKLLLILNGSYSISANYSVRLDVRFPIFLDIGA